MRKPIIAIVGRPNVGKSTLFNRIMRKRLAVVEDIPGITRDRLYGNAEWDDKLFIVVDTGGFQSAPDEDIMNQVKQQALYAVEEADIIIMLMDSESGLTPLDIELNNALRPYNKQTFYAVNKIDGPRKEKALYDFYSMGVDLMPVSAIDGYGFEYLMDTVTASIPETAQEETAYPRIAIVGRPNVGKSTLVNSLLGKDRMIVSPVPGTTRDAVDSVCRCNKKNYILIDTAGIRKRGMMAKTFERYSFIRTAQNIESCDVALILLDSVDGVVETDQKIASLVHEAGKGSIILFNKWDLTEKNSQLLKKLQSELRNKLWFMPYAQIITISALNRQRVTKLFPIIDQIIAESAKRIGTHELNDFLRESLLVQPLPLYRGKSVKVHYITQVSVKPPSFAIFSNRSKGIKPDYLRYLEKRLRERYVFKGVPLRFYVRQKA